MDEIVSVAQTFIDTYGSLMAKGVCDSIVMTGVSVLLAYLVGVPLGVILVITAKNGLHPKPVLNAVLGWVVNVLRSIPFIILLVCAIPFVARMVEQSLADIDGGLVEAGQSFGANTWQLVTKVYLKESLPSLIRGAAITFITLFGYAAMAGCVGAGGLGDIAIRYGYQRYKVDVMIVSVVLCVILVQVIQSVGDVIARKTDKRTR